MHSNMNLHVGYQSGDLNMGYQSIGMNVNQMPNQIIMPNPGVALHPVVMPNPGVAPNPVMMPGPIVPPGGVNPNFQQKEIIYSQRNFKPNNINQTPDLNSTPTNPYHSGSNIPEKKERVKKHLQDVPKTLGMVLISQIVGAVVSVVVAILGGILMMYLGNTFGIIAIAFAIVAFLTFLFGIFAASYYVQRVKKYLNNPDKEDPEKIDQSKERVCLNIYMYFAMFCFAFFIVLGIGVLCYRDDIKLYIKSLAYDQKEWIDNFGEEKTYDDVISKFNTSVNCLGALGIIFGIILGVIIFISLKLFNAYRKWQTIVEFISILFFQLGFVCVYLSVYSQRFTFIAETGEGMPDWIPFLLIIIAIIALAIGILGFVSAFLENISFINIFIWVVGIFSVVVLVGGCLGAYFISNIDNFVDAKCDTLFLYLQERYLKDKCGCDSKYLFVRAEPPEDECPKDRIIFAWEYETETETGETDDTLYGCINQKCCFNTFSSIKSKYDYLVLLVFALVLAGVLLIIGSYIMKKDLESNKEKGYKDSVTLKILGIVAGITLVALIIFISIIPSQSEKAEITKIKIDLAPKENAAAGKDSIIPPSSSVIKEKMNEKDKENADNLKSALKEIEEPPAPVNYKFTIEIKNQVTGTFSTLKSWPNDVQLDSSSSNTTNYIFTAPHTYTTTFMEYISFTPTCELDVVEASIKAEENSQVVFTQPIEYSKVYSTDIEIKGELKGDSGQIVFSQTVLASCPQVQESIPQGVFSISKKFHALLTDSPIEYNYKITPSNTTSYLPYEGKAVIGGLGWSNLVDLGTIELQKVIPPPVKSTISGTVKNALDNKNLEGAKINLYSGHIDFTSEQITNGADATLTPLKDAVSSSTGEFNFPEIEVGLYTLVYSKTNFYFTKYQLTLNENPLTVPVASLSPEVQEGTLRFVLSWPDGPSDLDFHAFFKVSSTKKCHVYFGNKNCVGSSLDVDNTKGGKNGVETITINELGNYIYMFYVHRYADRSNGVAAGESTAAGFNPSGSSSQTNASGTELYQSFAKISIFGYGYHTPIASIDVNTANANGNNQGKYWAVLCLDGKQGIQSLKVVNTILTSAPNLSTCERLY